jgi:hypothetical protein
MRIVANQFLQILCFEGINRDILSVALWMCGTKQDPISDPIKVSYLSWRQAWLNPA